MTASRWKIAVDWGTSSLRAWLLDPADEVAAQAARPVGILAVRDGGFAAVLAETVGAWRAAHPDASIIACGMVGSRQGWREAPYVACPAGVAELGRNVANVTAPGLGRVAIVPGVSREDEDGIPDVMRGEETQVMGVLAPGSEPGSKAERLVVLPGTHSKWVLARGARIVWFATFMTGELFAVLGAHSILGRLMTGDRDDIAAFDEGVARGATGALPRRLFSARTLGLFDRIPSAGLRSYLSGLLIGAEIAAAEEALAPLGLARRALTLVGEPRLAAHYERALAARGWRAEMAGEAPTIRGLARLAPYAEAHHAQGGPG